MKSLHSFLGAIATAFVLATPSLAEDLRFSVEPELPASHFIFQSVRDSETNNICKWHPTQQPGSRREVGQRIVTGKEPASVNRLVLRLAEISASVGTEAPGSELAFRIVEFANNQEISPQPEPLFSGTAKLPEVIGPGDYLVIDFPDTALEAGAVYGLEVGFTEAKEGNSLNFVTTERESHPTGRIYFHTNEPDPARMVYLLRSGNLVFHLGNR